jgi:hypothetical protein
MPGEAITGRTMGHFVGGGLDQPTRGRPARRRCQTCPAWLSQYNASDRCGACRQASPGPTETSHERQPRRGTVPDAILAVLATGPRTTRQLTADTGRIHESVKAGLQDLLREGRVTRTGKVRRYVYEVK